jgi:hypothetical protein
MNEKLVRNTSDARSREWWKAVQAAAANAPRLNLQRTSKTSSESRASAGRPRPQKKPERGRA